MSTGSQARMAAQHPAMLRMVPHQTLTIPHAKSAEASRSLTLQQLCEANVPLFPAVCTRSLNFQEFQ